MIGFLHHKNLERIFELDPPCVHERLPEPAKQTQGMSSQHRHFNAQVSIFFKKYIKIVIFF